MWVGYTKLGTPRSPRISGHCTLCTVSVKWIQQSHKSRFGPIGLLAQLLVKTVVCQTTNANIVDTILSCNNIKYTYKYIYIYNRERFSNIQYTIPQTSSLLYSLGTKYCMFIVQCSWCKSKQCVALHLFEKLETYSCINSKEYL